MQKIRTGRHCTFVMHVHLVFVTRFRHKVFTDAHLVRMEEIMRSVCADFESELVEFNGEDNHVHLLVNFPPKAAVTKLVNSLKGVSSRRLRLGAPPGRRLGESFRTWYATTGGPTNCGRGPTSPKPWAAPRSASSSSTSNSRTGPCEHRSGSAGTRLSPRSVPHGTERGAGRTRGVRLRRTEICDAPRRHGQIRFTTGVNPGALRMNPGSGHRHATAIG